MHHKPMPNAVFQGPDIQEKITWSKEWNMMILYSNRNNQFKILIASCTSSLHHTSAN